MGKRTMIALAALASLAVLAPLAAEDAAAAATPKDKDAYVLFQLSYADADGAKDPTVKSTGKPGRRALAYADHVLSCGTRMSGTLKESTKSGVVSVKGSFMIAENPYGITSLEIDLRKPKYGGKWNGTLVVDGQKIAAELVQ